MQKEYFELQVTPDRFFDLFCDLIFEFGIEAIEKKNDTIIVRSENDPKDIKQGVEIFAEKLSDITKSNISVTTKVEKKANQDWIDKYKNSIVPIIVGKFYIHPTWKEDRNGYINISLDPALSFGTGHHESTSSCLEVIDRLVKKNSTFLDVGCGSGILSIAASKMGAIVDLCDSDELSIQSAKKNFELNKTRYSNIWIGSANQIKKRYDMVVANIVADVLIMISKDLKRAVKDNGNLVLSGILDKYLDKVLSKFDDFKIVEIINKGEWRTLHLINTKETSG